MAQHRRNDSYRHQADEWPVTIRPVAQSPSPGPAPGRRRRVLLVSTAVLAVLIAVTAVSGGFGTRPSGPLAAKPGRVVNQGLFDVDVLDARSGMLKLHEFDKSQNLLIVRMRVTNLGKQTYGITTFLTGIAAEPKSGRYIDADMMMSIGDINGGETSSIHPGLPVVLQIVWPLGNATAPSNLTLALRQWDYGQSFTSDTFYWSTTKSSPITAKVTMPVRLGATS
jgi:hypothetical protein